MHVVLFGPPACGKGTQSKLLIERGFTHLSTGDMLRTHPEYSALLGTGKLATDQLVVGMIDDVLRLSYEGASFIYDGFPRTMSQAHALDEMLARRDQKIDLLISLEVVQEALVDRVAKRALTGGRADDNPETLAIRLGTYHERTRPVLDHYAERGIVVPIDGMQDRHEVANQIASLL